MAPQMGPKEAPMRPNTAPKSPATRVTAKRMLTKAPKPTDRKELTCGITVLKLLAAMNDEKQAPGKAASVRPTIMADTRPAGRPALSDFRPLVKVRLCLRASSEIASPGFGAGRAPEAWAPATARVAPPAVIKIAKRIPASPPRLTSAASLLFMPKSTPAAPAVAKNPTMVPVIAVIANSLVHGPPSGAIAAAGRYDPADGANFTSARISTANGINGKKVATLATY